MNPFAEGASIIIIREASFMRRHNNNIGRYCIGKKRNGGSN